MPRLSIPTFLFTTIYRHVLIINEQQPPPYQKLIIFTYIYVLVRLIITNYCLQFDVSIYFEYDVINRLIFYETILRKKYLPFFFSFIPVFSLRLLCLIYLYPDRLFWEHIYDLLIRNRNQAYLKLHNFASTFNCSTKHFSAWIPRLKVPKSSKLLYYPFLSRKTRTRCIAIYLSFEVILTAIQQIFVLFFALAVINLKTTLKISLTIAQALFVGFNALTFSVYVCFMMQVTALIVVNLCIVCYVYVLEYHKLNRKLQKIITSNTVVKTIRLSFAYRSAHNRLTVFILHYNSNTMSKIVISYLFCIMPFHSYGLVMVYFQSRDLPTFLALNLTLTLFLLAAILFGINLAVTTVNKAVSSSGPLLGAIFARKPCLVLVGNSHNNNKKVHTKIWITETLKLASYFELVWRRERELGFTAGQTTTMNWKFMVDVSLNQTNKKTDTHTLPDDSSLPDVCALLW